MISLKQYLDESLLKHIAIELKNIDIIYEKYGEYNGCNELSEYIYEKLKQNNFKSLEINYKAVKDIDNIVFDKLYIISNESNQNIVSYLIPSIDDKQFLIENNLNDNYKEYSIIDKQTNRFKYCLIILYTSDFRNTKIKSLLNHELTHLYNDFKIQCIGITSFFNLFSKDSYKRTKEYNQHKRPLSARKLQNALYLMNEYEKNAFISELCSEIRELKESDNYYKNGKLDANLIYDMVKKLDIYKAYMDIGNFINDYDNNALTKNEKRYIIEEWNRIYNENLTIEQIFKKLKKQFIKTRQKIESIIPKKIIESFKFNGVAMDEGINICNPCLT